MSNSNKIKGLGTLIFFLFLAILFSPFVFIGAGIYLAYIIRRKISRKKLLKQIKREWFLKGKYVFFLYSSSEKWKDYFEENVLPKIADKASIWNWSTRQNDGWSDDIIEAKILNLYRPAGYFYPMAIVFLPSGKVEIFQFYESYIKMLKSGKDDYKKIERDFLGLIQDLR